jgi:hypothetical protein
MRAILHVLGMFVADLVKSRLEAEKPKIERELRDLIQRMNKKNPLSVRGVPMNSSNRGTNAML